MPGVWNQPIRQSSISEIILYLTETKFRSSSRMKSWSDWNWENLMLHRGLMIVNIREHILLTLFVYLKSMYLLQSIGHISGCHINPAITIAMFVTRHTPLFRAICYIVMQCLGGIAGSALLKVRKGLLKARRTTGIRIYTAQVYVGMVVMVSNRSYGWLTLKPSSCFWGLFIAIFYNHVLL